MSVETYWHIEKRLLYQRFSGEVTEAEYAASVQEVSKFIAEGIPLVHAIADVQAVTKYPPLGVLSRYSPRTPFKGLGWTVVVVQNPLVRFVTTILAQFTVSHLRVSNSVEEALLFLTQRDHTLDLSTTSNHD